LSAARIVAGRTLIFEVGLTLHEDTLPSSREAHRPSMESGASSDEDLYKLLMQGYDFDDDEDDDDDYVDALVPDEALRDAATLASSRRKRSGLDDEDESGAATEASSVADDDDDSDDSHCTNKQRLAFLAF